MSSTTDIDQITNCSTRRIVTGVLERLAATKSDADAAARATLEHWLEERAASDPIKWMLDRGIGRDALLTLILRALVDLSTTVQSRMPLELRRKATPISREMPALGTASIRLVGTPSRAAWEGTDSGVDAARRLDESLGASSDQPAEARTSLRDLLLTDLVCGDILLPGFVHARKPGVLEWLAPVMAGDAHAEAIIRRATEDAALHALAGSPV